METTAEAVGRTIDGYLRADFPWYALDEAFTGHRWLTPPGISAEGTTEHGAVGHGDEPSVKVDDTPDTRRFTVVVSVAPRPLRRSTDGTGTIEATSVATAAWLAGSGLLSCTWPTHMERHLREDWLEQQTAIAWELADDLSGPGWSSLTLPVNGEPTPFHYRESEYGWVLAGTARGAHLGGYGRGISAYGLGLAVVKDIAAHDG
jgi:hypothetical protein